MDWKQKYYEELYHHGIKGQRWGRRRFQNKDGSLTPAGRERYDDDADDGSSTTKKSLSEKIADITNRHKEQRLAAEARKLAIDDHDYEAVEAIRKRVKELDDAMGVDTSPNAAKKYKESLKKSSESNDTQETGLVPVSKKASTDTQETGLVPVSKKASTDTQETGLVSTSKKSKTSNDDVEDLGEIKPDLDDFKKPSSSSNKTSDKADTQSKKIDVDPDDYTIDDTPGQKRKDAKAAERKARQEEAEKKRNAKEREREAEKNRKEEEAEKKQNEKEREEAKREKEKEEAEKERNAKEREKEAEKNKKEEEAATKKAEMRKKSPQELDAEYYQNMNKVNNLAGGIDRAASGLGRIVDVAERNRKQKAVRNSDAYQYTNKELDEKITRMQKEATYNEWKYTKQTSRGAEVAKNVLDTVGSVAVTAGAIAGVALTIKRLFGK